MKKIVLALALMTLVAANAEARGGRGWHHHHHHGAGPLLFFGALAALSIPFYYSRAWAEPGPYYYPAPTVYVNPPVYVQTQPGYVVNPPHARSASAPSTGEVIELGPVSALPPAHSGPDPYQSSNPPQATSDQWFVYPARGQSQQQQADDRINCNRWAVTQSGPDPELRVHRNPETGPAAHARALSACLEGRGYAVR